jgi:hypothetical protein
LRPTAGSILTFCFVGTTQPAEMHPNNPLSPKGLQKYENDLSNKSVNENIPEFSTTFYKKKAESR